MLTCSMRDIGAEISFIKIKFDFSIHYIIKSYFNRDHISISVTNSPVLIWIVQKNLGVSRTSPKNLTWNIWNCP